MSLDRDLGCDAKDEEMRRRIQKFAQDPVVQALQNQAGYLPIWAMAGGAVSYFCTDYAHKSGRINPSSPRILKFGIAAVGMMAGLQAGLWKMRFLYSKLDPTGDKMKEAKSLFEEVRKQRASSCPLQNKQAEKPSSANNPNKAPKTNKYGDPIDD